MAKDRRGSNRNKLKNKPQTLREQAQNRLGGMARYGQSKHDSKINGMAIQRAELQSISDDTPPKNWDTVRIGDVLDDKNTPQHVRTFLRDVAHRHPESDTMAQAFTHKNEYISQCRENGLGADSVSAYTKSLSQFQHPVRTPHSGELTPKYHGEIFSHSTMNTYAGRVNTFINWCEKEGIKENNIDGLEKYVKDYLVDCQIREKSDSTIKGYDSALCKLYGHSCRHYMELSKRACADYVHNRSIPPDYNVEKHQNRQVMEVIRSSGLRKSELSRIYPEKFTKEVGADGKERYFVEVDSKIGKGGLSRKIECLDSRGYDFAQKSIADGNRTLFDSKTFPDQMNHWYRSDFARSVYDLAVSQLPPPEKHDLYYCRGAKKGLVYDRRALAEVSHRLGHGRERLSLAVNNYLFPRSEECDW